MINLDYYTDLEIDITSKCNLDCPLCYRYDNKPLEHKDMSLVDYQRCIKLFPNLKRVYLGFLLSEPTMHKEFLEIVEWTKDQNINITLSTNGNIGTKAMWTKLMKLLGPNDKIIWPIDGSTQEIYEKYRVGGKLDKVLENQQFCVNLNSNVEHVTQHIQFEHNAGDDYNKIQTLTKGTTFQKISCCGDCGSPAKGITPQWDINEWIRIKQLVYSNKIVSKTINCMTKDERIIFITYDGVIGFCPSYLAEYLKSESKITIYNTDQEILNYINDAYNNRFNNKVCQFNCGQMALKLKELKNLGKVSL